MRRPGCSRWIPPALLAAGLFVTPKPSFGQASQSEMLSFPMPPAVPYAHTKHFTYTGDFGYFMTPPSAVYGIDARPSDYSYVRYTGIGGRKVYFFTTWGTTHIGSGSAAGDNCGHAHVSYGVWLRYEVVVAWFLSISGWVFAGGGGMSGQRVQGQCVFRTDNPLRQIDPRYGWGEASKGFDLRPFPFFREAVVGALSNTHGWGSCVVPPESFPACHEPSQVGGYTLP